MKSDRTHYNDDAEDKERIIIELKDRIRVLEEELRLRQKDQINPGIAESRRAAKAMRKSEASLARSQAITHLANWEVDVNTGRVWVSDEFYNIFNVEPGTPQEAYVEKIHPDDRPGVIESVDAAIYEGKPYSIDYRIVPRPGEVRHVHAEGETVRDGAGRPLSFFGTVQDITEHKRAEDALRASEEKFRVLAETTKAAIVLIQGNRFIYVNPTVERVLGYSQDELMAMDYWDVIHPDSMELLRSRGQLRQQRMPVLSNYELKALTKSGELRWGEITVGSIDYGDRPTTIATAFDITERKRTDDALRVSEERLRRACSAGHIGLYEWNVDRDLIRFSPEAFELYGLEPGSLVTYGEWLPCVHPGDRGMVGRRFAENQANARRKAGLTSQIEYRVVHADGAVLWLEVQSTYTLEGGDLIVRGAVRDITDRKRAEEALQESEARFSAFMDNSPGIAWMKDERGVYVYLNKVCGERLGIGPDHALGKTDHELFPQDIADQYCKIDRDVLASGRMTVQEDETVSPDGRGIQWLCVKFPFKCASGKGYVGGIAVDITEKKRAEEALRVSEERLRRASSAGHIGLFEWNVDRGMVYLRPEAYELYGLGQGSLATYEKWLSTVHPDDREMVERTFAEAYEKARNISHISTQLEYRTVHPDGTVLWLLATASCTIEGGDLIVRGAVRDITDRKKAEKELEESKEQAELYLDLMGHDINNFNLVARGYLELLDGVVEDEKLKDLVAKPLEAIDSSSRLIRNVQKLQRARSGESRVDAVDLGALVMEVAGQFKSLPDMHVNISCDTVKGITVRANDLLGDVFLNLVGNAIKHSAESPHIAIRMVPEDKDDCRYCKVIFDDYGPGIPDDMKEKIFDRLRRGNTKAKGSGLGLYLVRSLVESYGGRVWVEDRVPGDHAQGARFVVLLPAVET